MTDEVVTTTLKPVEGESGFQYSQSTVPNPTAEGLYTQTIIANPEFNQPGQGE